VYHNYNRDTSSGVEPIGTSAINNILTSVVYLAVCIA